MLQHTAVRVVPVVVDLRAEDVAPYPPLRRAAVLRRRVREVVVARKHLSATIRLASGKTRMQPRCQRYLATHVVRVGDLVCNVIVARRRVPCAHEEEGVVVGVLVATIAAHEGPEPCLRRVVLVVDLVARQQAKVLLVPLFRLGKVWHLAHARAWSTSRAAAGGKGGEQVERHDEQDEQQEKRQEKPHE